MAAGGRNQPRGCDVPTWTTTPPTVPGVYWWGTDSGLATVARVGPLGATDAHMLGVAAGALGAVLLGSESPVTLGRLGGEWWGPVAPPGGGGAVVSDSDRGPATADGEPWKGV